MDATPMPKVRRPKGPRPDTTYRCLNLENLAFYFQNELQSTSQSLIPETDSAQFVFYNDSVILLSATAALTGNDTSASAAPINGNTESSISLQDALYRTTEPKARVKPQRVVAKSIIAVFQEVDGFKYTERQAGGYAGNDGTRYKFVCADSLQNRDRVANGGSRAQGTLRHLV
jgi:hypothetical protein